MSGGYVAPDGDGLGPLVRQIEGLARRLREAETTTGTSMNSLVEQVQEAIANIDATVTAAIAANSYTKAEIDGKIASPGNIAPGTVTASGNVNTSGSVNAVNMTASGNVNAVDMSASGRVFSQGPLVSPGSHDYIVTTSYVAAWINSDGTVGTSPSSAAVKKNLTPMGDDAATAVLSLTPYWGQYVWDDDGSPPKVFLIAEEVAAAGFGPDVAPTHDDGVAYTVNYSQLVVPLLAAMQSLEARITALGG